MASSLRCRHAMLHGKLVDIPKVILMSRLPIAAVAMNRTADPILMRRGLHVTSRRGSLAATPSAAAAAAATQTGAGTQGGKKSGASGQGEGGKAAGIALFSALIAVTAGLGTWQSIRYSWKVGLVESRRESMALEPVDLPTGSRGTALAEAMDILDKAKAWADGGMASKDGAGLLTAEGNEVLSELAGRRVSVTGVFDHSKEVLVGPRGAPPGMKSSSGGSSMATSPMGDFVYTPIKIKNGPIVLFNRGWAPRAGGTDWGRPTGEVTVVGVLKAAEPRGTFSPENANPEEGRLLWPEKSSLLKAACLVDSTPILMEAVGEDGTDPRAEIPMAKRQYHFGEFYVMPNTHLMYAGTWYSLAAAASVLTWVRFRRKPLMVPRKR